MGESVLPLHFEDLGKGAFHEAGRHAQERHYPHPEESAGTAHDKCQGNTGDITGAHA